MEKIKILIKELRAEFLTASVLPVLVATTLSYFEKSTFNLRLFLLTLAGVIFLHLGTNVANDYFDHKSGNDELNRNFVRPFTGGSRLIQDGLLSPNTVLTMSILFFSLGIIAGIPLIVSRGPIVLVLGLIGIVSGYFYTAPPFKFAYRGIGEFIIGVNFGILITCGAYFVQTGTISPSALIVSIPLAILISSVVIINEFQDSEADSKVGKRTIVVRIGKRNSVTLLTITSIVSFLPLVLGVFFNYLPIWILISLGGFIPLIKGLKVARIKYNNSIELAPANASFILGHTLTALLMVAGLTISILNR